jgi:hypothetical protein
MAIGSSREQSNIGIENVGSSFNAKKKQSNQSPL